MRQVGWDKKSSKWRASCRVDGKTKHLGSFDDEIEAARAFDAATKDIAYYQREGKVNFPAEQDEERDEQDAWSSQYFGVRAQGSASVSCVFSILIILVLGVALRAAGILGQEQWQMESELSSRWKEQIPRFVR